MDFNSVSSPVPVDFRNVSYSVPEYRNTNGMWYRLASLTIPEAGILRNQNGFVTIGNCNTGIQMSIVLDENIRLVVSLIDDTNCVVADFPPSIQSQDAGSARPVFLHCYIKSSVLSLCIQARSVRYISSSLYLLLLYLVDIKYQYLHHESTGTGTGTDTNTNTNNDSCTLSTWIDKVIEISESTVEVSVDLFKHFTFCNGMFTFRFPDRLEFHEPMSVKTTIRGGIVVVDETKDSKCTAFCDLLFKFIETSVPIPLTTRQKCEHFTGTIHCPRDAVGTTLFCSRHSWTTKRRTFGASTLRTRVLVVTSNKHLQASILKEYYTTENVNENVISGIDRDLTIEEIESADCVIVTKARLFSKYHSFSRLEWDVLVLDSRIHETLTAKVRFTVADKNQVSQVQAQALFGYGKDSPTLVDKILFRYVTKTLPIVTNTTGTSDTAEQGTVIEHVVKELVFGYSLRKNDKMYTTFTDIRLPKATPLTSYATKRLQELTQQPVIVVQCPVCLEEHSGKECVFYNCGHMLCTTCDARVTPSYTQSQHKCVLCKQQVTTCWVHRSNVVFSQLFSDVNTLVNELQGTVVLISGIAALRRILRHTLDKVSGVRVLSKLDDKPLSHCIILRLNGNDVPRSSKFTTHIFVATPSHQLQSDFEDLI